MDVPLWLWFATVGLIVVMLTVDFVGHVRTPHAPSLKEAGAWSAAYVAIALVFGALVWFLWDHTHGVAYFSGYLLEKSLSLDNLFVFVLIMASFRVPREYQQKVLLIGIVIALVMRTVFIVAGVAIVENFSWVFWIFGGFLLWTAWSQLRQDDDEDEEFTENIALRGVRRLFPTTDGYEGDRMLVRRSGRLHVTPMLVVMLAIGSADLLFAVDSIPAIFGVTEQLSGASQVYIIFAANAFSLLGLRQLFFLVDGLLDKLVYLNYGLAAILAFIGVKLLIHAMHTNELSWLNGGEHITVVPEVPSWLSLVVIVVVLTITTVTSLTIGARREEPATTAGATAAGGGASGQDDAVHDAWSDPAGESTPRGAVPDDERR
ncbi:MAG TPA: TerC family protein [Actinotalea caeni]|uniref:TerC family protein n=1 Tax=Actinotalea caeni TaxID=1348467 RepID=UPI002B4AF9FC|nr:TerC family protein [Actinotalea caeni]HLV56902.1 TerC family protein [Actinotalea caeni]